MEKRHRWFPVSHRYTGNHRGHRGHTGPVVHTVNNLTWTSGTNQRMNSVWDLSNTSSLLSGAEPSVHCRAADFFVWLEEQKLKRISVSFIHPQFQRSSSVVGMGTLNTPAVTDIGTLLLCYFRVLIFLHWSSAVFTLHIINTSHFLNEMHFVQHLKTLYVPHITVKITCYN